MNHAPNHIISLDHVWVSYRQNVALEDITLKVHENEIVSIVGPNGAGKSTLIHVILGFVKVKRGEVLVFGKPPADKSHRGMIGYLPQENQYDSLFPVNVFDVVAMARHARKKWSEKLNERDILCIQESLGKVGMGGQEKEYFGGLSSGQKQRVLIARALTLDPRILILDEPSTGLDAVAQDNFYKLLQKLRDENSLTILMVSHDIGTVSSFTDCIACLNRRLHFHGKPGDCIPSEALVKVFGSNVQFLLHDHHCETCENV